MEGSLELQFGNATLQLLPEHAVWCPESATVWIADLHLGKEQTFRRSGIPVPDLLAEDLARLTRILRQTAAKQLYILGDLLHASVGQSQRLHDTLVKWRGEHNLVEMTLVRGNHDRQAGDPPGDWRLQCVEAPSIRRDFTLSHEPMFGGQTLNLAGHLHPKWRGRTRADDLKLPCFLLRRRTLVLPAFGRFIDSAAISPEAGDRVYVIANGKVLPTQRESKRN